jgi:hypothetical protein
LRRSPCRLREDSLYGDSARVCSVAGRNFALALGVLADGLLQLEIAGCKLEVGKLDVFGWHLDKVQLFFVIF